MPHAGCCRDQAHGLRRRDTVQAGVPSSTRAGRRLAEGAADAVLALRSPVLPLGSVVAKVSCIKTAYHRYRPLGLLPWQEGAATYPAQQARSAPIM